MLVQIPSSLLANQMFQYAVAKSISIDKGQPLKLVVPLRTHKPKDTNQILGSHLWTAFHNIIDTNEILKSEDVDSYIENNINQTVTVDDLTYEDCLQYDDATFFKCRLLWHPDNFMHNIIEIRRCFELPMNIQNEVNEKINSIKINYSNRPIVAVHFRVGWDYFREGRVLNYQFWRDAAKQANTDYDTSPIFCLIYDTKTSYIKKFQKEFETIDVRGNMFNDLLFMSKADGLIVGNSTFGTWGGLLNSNNEFRGYHPSIFPIDRGKCATNAWFPEEWIEIKTYSNVQSRIFGFFYQNFYQLPVRGIKQIIKKILCAKKKNY